jgi:DNA-binding NarL/FixJ family response regulator
VTEVLVVMTEEVARDGFARELAKADCRVFACSTFEEGREALDRGVRPDVLVTNLRLKEYNGLSLVIRANERCPSARKIVCTEFDDPVLRREAMIHGATFVYSEETSPEALMSAFAA